MTTFAVQIINNMKGTSKHSKDKEEDSDSDGFDYEEWKRSKKVQTQELPKEEFLKERSYSDMDSKKTVKYKEDPVMNSMY
jgi:hypothetical protein